ncbi:MAG TPA: c-type cytochrome [Rhodanobacteraceae bacterium]|nr:c-type cytochrome [Rhodanobacteraceae bacterium]
MDPRQRLWPWIAGFIGCALVLAATAATPSVPDTLQQRIAGCTGCHGLHGEGGGNGFNPRIAGKPALYLYRQLLNFRDGRRSYPLMEHMVRPLSDTYLREIADYFAAQQPPHPPAKDWNWSSDLLERGRTLVHEGDPRRGVPACVACHGERLTGVEPAVPALLGLPYDYISAQLGAWRTHTRGAPAPDCMAGVAAHLSDSDIGAVAAWLSSRDLPTDARPQSAASTPAPLACGSIQQTGEVAGGDAAVALSRGEYLARAGDCISCHTSVGSEPFAGGRAIPTDFGTFYAPNITPDVATGIGGWTADDFWEALHNGRAPDGRLLYPAFPYPSYTRVTRADADAIYAWLRTVKPVRRNNDASTLDFPYNLRKLLLAWRALYFKAGEYVADPHKSATWNRGAYLVQGLGHCSGCHTPRNALGASRENQHLAGAMIQVQDWYAPDLGTGPGGGLAGWNAQDIVDLLKTGRSARGTAYGPMAEVVQHSLQYLDDADAQAIATYLLDQPGRDDAAAQDGDIVVPPTQDANLVAEGRAIYGHSCAACHGDDGRGVPGAYPPLAGNTSLLAATAVNPVRAVLLGGFEPGTRTDPRSYSMPPFVQQMDDRQVAAVVTYLRQAWGNHAPAVSPDTVRKYRSTPVYY